MARPRVSPTIVSKELQDHAANLRRKRRGLRKKLSLKKEQAAVLVAEGKMSYREICRHLGLHQQQINHWRREDPDFVARIEIEKELFSTHFMFEGLARKEVRIAGLTDLHERIERIFQERGDSDDMSDVPGGQTGLITKTYKGIGKGKQFRLIPEYAVDTATIREKRAIFDDVAAEVGGRIRKLEHGGSDGKPLQAPTININFVSARKS